MSLFLLILFSPVFILTSLAIKIEDLIRWIGRLFKKKASGNEIGKAQDNT